MGLVQSAYYVFGKSLNYQRKRKRHSCRQSLNESDDDESDSGSSAGLASKRYITFIITNILAYFP